ncbi:glycosyltransferase [Arthrobacter sp. MYb222]|uniref:CgeB family protein n=1 Tax=Arthrobacter sp. MYb222 TaxID=1848599 RepID=UPI000CFD4FDB|nr:glycosyltransferase [Arthrobacter sp. MYb222]PQZ83530.1 glycosyltransferase [Arthrobacter sp. MYb222]
MRIGFQELRKLIWHFREGGIEQAKEWQRRSRYQLRVQPKVPAQLTAVERDLGIQFPSIDIIKTKTSANLLNVAVILDDFSAKSWSPEWNCTFITPQSWKNDLVKNDFDFLFVESAWAGNNKTWQYHLTGPTAPRPSFTEMVKGFKERSIPTVFWNKEDPPHYGDFLDSAKLFDLVFTSDSRKICDYQKDLGHDRVAALSFAAQPSFHNPVRDLSQTRRDVAFAGMYFAEKYPERREQMDIVLGGTLDVLGKLPHGLDIFSRQFGGDAKYQFPEPYAKHVVGSLEYERMLSAYKYYNVFLNVNSVIDSPSMCARRIFEITAAGTPVVSAPSVAIENFFSAEEVVQVSTREEASYAIRSIVQSPELRDRIVHLGQRKIWKNHTYAHRAQLIQDLAGVKVSSVPQSSMAARPKISVVVSTIRPQQLNHIFETVGRQKDVDIELILVAHKFKLSSYDLKRLASNYNVDSFIALEMGMEHTLGDCLNSAVSRASGSFITKMDDDDLYGDYYLFDQVAALRYSGASIVGKQAHFMYLADSDATLLRFADREHRFTDLVMGPTMLGHAEIFKNTPFESRSRGEDTKFLRDVIADGGTVYSSDRYNFMQMRGSDGKHHTWDLSDAELTATGIIQWFGRNDQHVFF